LDLEVINLDTPQAVPLGLILNEAITNSIKHAFVNRHSGLISLSLKRSGQDRIRLSIKDNGEGISGDFNDLNLNHKG